MIVTGGIAPEHLDLIAIAGRDLLIAMPDGSVLIVGFFDGAGAGIERIVFDHAPAWDRSEIVARATADQSIVAADADAPAPLSSAGDLSRILADTADDQSGPGGGYASAFLFPVF